VGQAASEAPDSKNVKYLTTILAALTVCAAQAADRPRYPVQPVSEPPLIDGKLDDAAWQQSPSAGPFVDTGSKPAKPQTALRFAYDDNNLYIAARIEEPEMDKVKAAIIAHDGGVWKDDSLRIFLGTGGKATPYQVFSINSIGTMEETSMDAAAASFNVPWEAEVVREDAAWTVEAAIPFTSLGNVVPKAESVWRGNVCRDRSHAKSLSSWSRTPGSFHDTNAFGQLYFLDKVYFNEIALKPEGIEGGANLRVEVRGPEAWYRTRLFGFLDGKQEPAPKELYGAFKTTPNKLSGADHKYVRPGAQQMILQPEINEGPKPNRTLFRGEAIVVKETDPVVARLAETDRLLKEFPPAQAPNAVKDVAPTWEQRLADLRKTPDLVKTDALLQEIRSAQWLSRLPSAADAKPEPGFSAAKPVLTFPVPSFMEVNDNFLPDPAAVGGAVNIQAMRGEYEPGCLNVFALDADHEVLVSVGDLKGPGGAILPGTAFDIRVLKGWYQAGRGNHQDPSGVGVWANELLLKDDSIITSDHAIGRNTIHRRKDTTELQPVKIGRFQSRQFWLTLLVPANQPAGLYEGQVRVTSGGEVVANVPLRVNILPLTLEKGKFTHTMYYMGRLGKNEKFDRWYEGDLKIMAEHGLTSVWVQDGAKATQAPGGMVTDYDFSLIRRALELRKKYGLTGRTILNGGWDTQPVDFLLRTKTPEQMAGSAVSQNNWKVFGKGFADLAAEMGFEAAYIYGLDEPGYDTTGKKLAIQKILCTWAKEAGFDVASAITLSGAESIKDVFPLPILDGNSAGIGGGRRKLPFDGEVWLYVHHLEHPTFDRLMNGIVLWYGGYTGAAPWIYKSSQEEWDDWATNSNGYRQYSYVYPGDDGPITTRQFEGFREGADDVKYLEMLANRVAALAGSKDQLDEPTRAAWLAADELVNTPPKPLQGNMSALTANVDGKMLANFRAQVADLLVKLTNER
jgi:hypothetical protein